MIMAQWHKFPDEIPDEYSVILGYSDKIKKIRISREEDCFDWDENYYMAKAIVSGIIYGYYINDHFKWVDIEAYISDMDFVTYNNDEDNFIPDYWAYIDDISEPKVTTNSL